MPPARTSCSFIGHHAANSELHDIAQCLTGDICFSTAWRPECAGRSNMYTIPTKNNTVLINSAFVPATSNVFTSMHLLSRTVICSTCFAQKAAAHVHVSSEELPGMCEHSSFRGAVRKPYTAIAHALLWPAAKTWGGHMWVFLGGVSLSDVE